MTTRRAMELLMIERSCVRRGSGMMLDPDLGYLKVTDECNRDCVNCELVQDSRELLEMYDFVITKMIRELESEEGGRDKLLNWQLECASGPLKQLAI